MEAESASDSGNTPRNKHRHEAGDFVMFADDDNHYTADALSNIRKIVQHDHEALYIFQMRVNEELIIPQPGNGNVTIGNVDSGRHIHHANLQSVAMHPLQYATQCIFTVPALGNLADSVFGFTCRLWRCAFKVCAHGRLDSQQRSIYS